MTNSNLQWALLVPLDAATLRRHVERYATHALGWNLDEDDPSLWSIMPGTGQYSAVLETEPGSSGTEVELAKWLADLGLVVYAVGFSGYDDPDHGLPYIECYGGKEPGLVWSMPDVDFEGDPNLATVPGPDGVPCDDPFAFTLALGCDLRSSGPRDEIDGD